MNKMNAKNLPDNILKFVRTLKITSGDHLDEPVTILPWQERLIRGAFRPGIQTAALGISRGNGKTSTVSWLALAVVHPSGPLNHRNAKVIVAAASHEQGATIHKAVCDLLPDRHNRDLWSIWDSNRLRIRNKENGAELQVLSFNPGASHGIMGATLLLADEVSQWPKGGRDRQWNALEGTLGKSPGCRLIALGTRPSDADNPFTKMLDGQADFVVEYKSRAKKYWWKESAIRTANPSLDHFPSLKEAIDRDARLARRDPAKLAAFRSYRLNQGTEEGEVRNQVISAHDYAKNEADQVDIGPEYVLGLDLSGGHAQTGVAAVNLYPDPDGKHHVDAFACWPSSANLKERSERDDVDYTKMERDGDLLILPGATVQVDQVMAEAQARWGARPVAVVSDYFRISESRFVLENLGYVERETLIYRRMGWGDGAEDLRRFRRMIADGTLLFRKSLLMRTSFSVARTISDLSGNEKMSRETERNTKGKDDPTAGILIAAAECHRRESTPVESGVYVYHVV